MISIKPWQIVVLILPIAATIAFLLIAAGTQIHQWGVNWIWGIVVLIFALWRWLLVRWTKSPLQEIESALADLNQALAVVTLPTDIARKQATAAWQEVAAKTKNDAPMWEDWQTFWQRCLELVTAIARVYHPEVRRPLLNIYIPQAYGLLRGTVDDTDRMMQKLAPILKRVSVGQAVEAVEIYRQLEPSARKLTQVFNWSQWLFNPAAAVAKEATKRFNSQANQELLFNLGQLMREVALKNLAQQAIALYGDQEITLSELDTPSSQPQVATKTIRQILESAEPEAIAKPLNIMLVGRTGAGKSSIINSLFKSELAAVDVLPSTDQISTYTWTTPTNEVLQLWDTPGYEQANRPKLRAQVLDYATTADLLLLVTPALDPALQMDLDFLQALQQELPDLNTLGIVTQVDCLRPIREWQPPYDWQEGDRPKEKSIREATIYRAEQLGELCELVLPIVTADAPASREAWNLETLAQELIQAIDPGMQLRLARFLRNLEARSYAAAQIIDRYSRQMATNQGLANFLKSPILQFISTLTTGDSSLAYILAAQIPVEQAPVVIGKLQMAYDLFVLLNEDSNLGKFDLRSLWPILLENNDAGQQNTKAWGQAIIEYWSKSLSPSQLSERYNYYLQQK